MRQYTLLIFVLTLCCLGSILTSCGEYRDREEKVVYYEVDGGDVARTNQDGEQFLDQINEAWTFVFGNGGATRNQLMNLLNRFQSLNDSIKERFGADWLKKGLDTEKIVSFVFETFDPDGSGTIELTDVRMGIGRFTSALREHVPTFKWVKRGEKLTALELARRIEVTYPGASSVARRGLADALLRYDHVRTGGNGDGRIEQSEVGAAGAWIALMSRFNTDLLNTVPDGISEKHKFFFEVLHGKMLKQIAGRYPTTDFSALRPLDLHLEWISMGLVFESLDRVRFSFADGKTGTTQRSELPLIVESVGFPRGETQLKVLNLYDEFFALATGAEESSAEVGTLEIYNLVTDLEYAAKINKMIVAGHIETKVEVVEGLAPYFSARRKRIVCKS